jgi:hypothetical protein
MQCLEYRAIIRTERSHTNKRSEGSSQLTFCSRMFTAIFHKCFNTKRILKTEFSPTQFIYGFYTVVRLKSISRLGSVLETECAVCDARTELLNI